MPNDRTEELLREREVCENKRSDLRDREWQITCDLCKINGNCPKCHNTHYPHCGDRE